MYNVSLAGSGADDIINKINDAQYKKFNEPLKQRAWLKNEDVMLFSALEKTYSFEYPFEEYHPKLEMKYEFFSLSGERTPFQYAGLMKYIPKISAHKKIASQIEILYYKGGPYLPEYLEKFPDGEIIKLIANNSSDEIIISSLEPAATLLESYYDIKGIINKEKLKSIRSDILDILKKGFGGPWGGAMFLNKNASDLAHMASIVVPKINFNLIHNYGELNNNKILNNRSGLSIYDSVQSINIKFSNFSQIVKKRYDMLSFGYSLMYSTPFIIYFKSSSSDLPYFMAYIGNAELLFKPDEFQGKVVKTEKWVDDIREREIEVETEEITDSWMFKTVDRLISGESE